MMQKIGFSVKNIDEFERIKEFKKFGVNTIEVKMNYFEDSGMPFLRYDGCFYPVKKNIEKLASLRSGLFIQSHLFFDNDIDISQEKGLNMAVIEHHSPLLERAKLIELIYSIYGIFDVNTTHLALLSSNGKKFLDEKVALRGARIFLKRLDRERIFDKHKTRMSFENVPDIKLQQGRLGYYPIHFAYLFKGIRTLGVTGDMGHIRLSKNMDFESLRKTGVWFDNFHIHTGYKNFTEKDWSDDEHLFAYEDNAEDFDLWIQHIRKFHTPVIFEIENLANYSNQDIKDYLKYFLKVLE